MDINNLKGLMEAYSEVHAPQEVEEAVRGADPEMRRIASVERKSGDKRLPPSKGKGYADQQQQQIAYMDKVTKKNKNIVGLVAKEELDIFDVVLEFLQAEGYAETLEQAEWMMANVIDEEAIAIILGEEQLDEISQKLATKAYAERRTGEFEGDDSPERIAKTDKLEKRIAKKFGPKAAAHADEAAAVKTFGRKDASGRRKQSPQPRIQTSDHENQTEFKRELRIRRDKRLRAKDNVNEAQHARENPEKYERDQEKRTSKREKAMNDPHTGINSPAFAEFMRKQMGR